MLKRVLLLITKLAHESLMLQKLSLDLKQLSPEYNYAYRKYLLALLLLVFAFPDVNETAKSYFVKTSIPDST